MQNPESNPGKHNSETSNLWTQNTTQLTELRFLSSVSEARDSEEPRDVQFRSTDSRACQQFHNPRLKNPNSSQISHRGHTSPRHHGSLPWYAGTCTSGRTGTENTETSCMRVCVRVISEKSECGAQIPTKPKVCKPGYGQPLKIPATSVPGTETYNRVTEVTFRMQNPKGSDVLVLDSICDRTSMGRGMPGCITSCTSAL